MVLTHDSAVVDKEWRGDGNCDYPLEVDALICCCFSSLYHELWFN